MKSTTEQIRWTGEAELSVQVAGMGKQESSAHILDLQRWGMSPLNTLFFRTTFAAACCCNSLFIFGCFLSCLWFCSSMFSHRSGVFYLPIFTTYLLWDSLWLFIYPSRVSSISTSTVHEDIHKYIYTYTHTTVSFKSQKANNSVFAGTQTIKETTSDFVYDSTQTLYMQNWKDLLESVNTPSPPPNKHIKTELVHTGSTISSNPLHTSGAKYGFSWSKGTKRPFTSHASVSISVQHLLLVHCLTHSEKGAHKRHWWAKLGITVPFA